MSVELYETMFRVRESCVRAAIGRLGLPEGSRGLDAGCNIGLITQLLADAVSPGGHVTGIDISPQYLENARSRAGGEDGARETADFPGPRCSFMQGDVNCLPFKDGCFDWVWSMDTIWPGPKRFGCPAEDPLPMVRELARVVRRGGTVALLYWSGQKLLPGYPLLEARLNCTSQAQAPFTPSMMPAHHFMRSLSWLRTAGLADVNAVSFVVDIVAPLSESARTAMAATFAMLWSGVKEEVAPEDWAEYNRLCIPESPGFILHNPDYFAFFNYTMFYGRAIEHLPV